MIQMNKFYGALLALIFLFGIGAFNVAMGVTKLKKKKVKKWICWFRIALGVPMIISPFIIYYYFRSQGAF